MIHLNKHSWWIIAVVLVLSVARVSTAQNTPDDQSVTEALLEAINNQRKISNVTYVFPNADLNVVASIYLNDYQNRDLTNLGDLFLLADGQTNLETLLGDTAYRAYSQGYWVDLVPIITDIPPEQVLNFIFEDTSASTADRQIKSRRMVRSGETRLPLFIRSYREVGIAYTFDSEVGRHYYVLVFGSQPGVLPIGLTDPTEPARLRSSTTSLNLELRLTNENTYGTGDVVDDVRYPGTARLIRISTESTPQECPTNEFNLPPGWSAYSNRIDYTLQEQPGFQIVYVQFCDPQLQSIMSAVQIDFAPGNVTSQPTFDPIVMQAVSATQSAAATATAIAPFQPTIEAILTATATSP